MIVGEYHAMRRHQHAEIPQRARGEAPQSRLVKLSNGAAQVKNFNASRMIRLNEMPAVKVKIMPAPAQADRTVAIGGVGELGVPTLAPALANSWARLTGQRVRSLPFYPGATMGDG